GLHVLAAHGQTHATSASANASALRLMLSPEPNQALSRRLSALRDGSWWSTSKVTACSAPHRVPRAEAIWAPGDSNRATDMRSRNFSALALFFSSWRKASIFSG